MWKLVLALISSPWMLEHKEGAHVVFPFSSYCKRCGAEGLLAFLRLLLITELPQAPLRFLHPLPPAAAAGTGMNNRML